MTKIKQTIDKAAEISAMLNSLNAVKSRKSEFSKLKKDVSTLEITCVSFHVKGKGSVSFNTDRKIIDLVIEQEIKRCSNTIKRINKKLTDKLSSI